MRRTFWPGAIGVPGTYQYILTIAIGAGAVTALLTLLVALGFRPLPFRQPQQLIAVWEHGGPSSSVLAVSAPDLADMAAASAVTLQSLHGFLAWKPWLFDSRGAVSVPAYDAQAGLISGLGIRPAIGRGESPGDVPIGRGVATAWISYRLWRSRYGGNPAVIGRAISVAQGPDGAGRVRAEIVGVLPSGITIPLPFGGSPADIWFVLPSQIAGGSRRAAVLFGVGRLRPGRSPAQAQAALAAVAARLTQRYPFERHRTVAVESLEAIAQGPARRTLGLLTLGIGLVFLIAGANLALLMVAEGARRRREIAIRISLGAGPWRLWTEVARQRCFLTLIALALGTGLSWLLLRLLAQLVPAAGIGVPLAHPPQLNYWALAGSGAFALALALLWSFLLISAAAARDPAGCLAGGGEGMASAAGAHRWRLLLLAAQAGIGVCLVAGAVLAARAYAAASAANLGPAPRQTVLVTIEPQTLAPLNAVQVRDFKDSLLARLAQLPATQQIALADQLPPFSYPMSFVKRDEAPGGSRVIMPPLAVSENYFRQFAIPVLYGRAFRPADNRPGAPPVAIISLRAAESNWPSPRDAVGSEIALGEKFEKPCLIVGVAGDFTGFWYQKPAPMLYVPEVASTTEGGTVVMRTRTPPSVVAALARQALAGMAIPADVSQVTTMQAAWQATLTRPFARTVGLLLLALLGLALSIQGVYAVAAATVADQTQELAVRCALGAPPACLVWAVTRSLVLAALAGGLAGALASISLQPLLEHWLGPLAAPGMGPTLAALILIAAAAAVGCYLPARAASRTDPAAILRQG